MEFEIEGVDKNLTKQEIRYRWKKIDRKLKSSTVDTEIMGLPNQMFQSPDDLPLTLYGIDNTLNALGGISVNELMRQINERNEQIGERRLRYNRLKEAQNHPEIVGTLNIYADEATTEDQDGNVIKVLHPLDDVVELLDDLYARLAIHDKSWQHIRDMCGFGDEFQEVVVSQSMKKILKLIQLPRPYIKRLERNGDLLGFEIADIELQDSSTLQYFTYSVNYSTEWERENKRLYPFRVIHWRIPSSKYGIYGEAVIDSVLSTIEMLNMMEKSLLVARITRAPERRIFQINVGNLQGEAAIKYVKEVMNSFRNKKRLDMFSKQKVDWQKDVFGTVEDIVIPKRAGDEGHSIDTLPSANNLDQIQDLEFLRDKIFPGIGIPRQYLFDDSFANANTNLSSKSKPFAKKIRRIQRCYLYGLYKLAFIEMKLNGYSQRHFDELVIVMNNPSNIDEKEKIEIETNKWNLITQMKSLNAEAVFFPDYLIYKDVLKLNDDDIVELMKLAELQASGKNIFEAFPLEDRPEGSEELAGVATPPAPAPEGGAGAPEASVLNAQPTEGGAEGEATPEGEKPEIPAEVAGQLGPPPSTPELAEYKQEGKLFSPYHEAIKKKEKFIKIFNELNEMTSKTIVEEQEKTRKLKSNVSYLEMELSGELEGLSTILKQYND